MFQNQWSITKTQTPFCSYCYLLSVILKKIFKENSLWVQVLKKGEKQWVMELIYRSIFRIQKKKFQ